MVAGSVVRERPPARAGRQFQLVGGGAIWGRSGAVGGSETCHLESATSGTPKTASEKHNFMCTPRAGVVRSAVPTHTRPSSNYSFCLGDADCVTLVRSYGALVS